MTPQPKDPAKMTKAELVSAVAVEVMRWTALKGKMFQDEKKRFHCTNKKCHDCSCNWNPLTDWNHWREVEEKIMEDDKRLRIFLDVLEPKDGEEDEWGGWHAALMAYLKADLRTRCVAAILAVRSASPNSL